MDHFEQELARMMRDGHEETLYEDRHRDRLHAGVRARRRARAAWTATGSVLTVAGLGVGLMVLPSSFAQDGPTNPQHRSGTPAEPGPTPSRPRPVPTATAPMPTCTSTARPVPMPYHLSTTAPSMPSRTSPLKRVPMPTCTSTNGPVPTPTQTSTAR